MAEPRGGDFGQARTSDAARSYRPVSSALSGILIAARPEKQLHIGGCEGIWRCEGGNQRAEIRGPNRNAEKPGQVEGGEAPRSQRATSAPSIVP